MRPLFLVGSHEYGRQEPLPHVGKAEEAVHGGHHVSEKGEYGMRMPETVPMKDGTECYGSRSAQDRGADALEDEENLK